MILYLKHPVAQRTPGKALSAQSEIDLQKPGIFIAIGKSQARLRFLLCNKYTFTTEL